MENFINNAPFALVLVALVIGFVLLIKGAIVLWREVKCGKGVACAGNHHRTYDRGDGNVASGDGGQCVGFSYRK